MQDSDPFPAMDGSFSGNGVPADGSSARLSEPLQLAVQLATAGGISAGGQSSPAGGLFSEAGLNRIWRCVRAATTEWQVLLRRGSRQTQAGGHSPAVPGPAAAEDIVPPACSSPDLIRTAPAQPLSFREEAAVIADVLAVDPLVRVLAARLEEREPFSGSADSQPLVSDLINRQTSIRNLALREMLAAPPARLQTIRQLDGFRRQLEVWTDLLLANLPYPVSSSGLACSASRYADFLQARQKSSPNGLSRNDIQQLSHAAHLLYAGSEIPAGKETAGCRGLLKAIRDGLAGRAEEWSTVATEPAARNANPAPAAGGPTLASPEPAANCGACEGRSEQNAHVPEHAPHGQPSLAWSHFRRIPRADRGFRPLRFPR